MGIVILSGCQKDLTIVRPGEETFSSQVNGQSALTQEHVMVIRNPFGGVSIAGEGRPDNSFRWYMYKTVTVLSNRDTTGLLSSITLSAITSNDTLYVEIISAAPYDVTAGCSIQLGIPYNLICKIEQVANTTQISDLDSLLIIENASAVNVLRHNG
jgi:hypothetical protein